jgi:CHC2 zinc finger
MASRPDRAGRGPDRAAARVRSTHESEERREFAELWERLGVHIEPGDRYYLCPLHDDHHPSLHIDADGCRWYCFGCGRGGGPGRLRRVVARQGHDARSVPAAVRVERSSATTRASVPSTWMQWPALQPGGSQAVVGEANYADTLERLAGGRTWSGPRTRWLTAQLVREHTNPHDPAAVRVEVSGCDGRPSAS